MAVIVVVVVAAVAVVGDMMVRDMTMSVVRVKGLPQWWGKDRIV